MTETRTLYTLHQVELPDGRMASSSESVTQEAIPWCTTHDEGAIADGFVVCRVGVVLGADVQTDCVILTGGPDHDWWVNLA